MIRRSRAAGTPGHGRTGARPWMWHCGPAARGDHGAARGPLHWVLGEKTTGGVGRRMVSQRRPHRRPRPCEATLSHGKRCHCRRDGVEGGETGVLSWVIWVGQCYHKAFLREGQEGQCQVEIRVRLEHDT